MIETDWGKVVNFKKSEFRHPEMLKPESVFMLDRQRTILGHPIFVTSDGRPPAENRLAGGVADSLHPEGEAFDSKCLKVTPLDYFLKACHLPWTEIGLYEIGILHLGFSLNPERRIKRFYGFQCPSCLDFAPARCSYCKGLGKIYRPISEEIIRWHLSDRLIAEKKRILGIP